MSTHVYENEMYPSPLKFYCAVSHFSDLFILTDWKRKQLSKK